MPTIEEWLVLGKYLGKFNTKIYEEFVENDSIGFDMVFGGYRGTYGVGEFAQEGTTGGFWSSTPISSSNEIQVFILNSVLKGTVIMNFSLDSGLSVRFFKD